MRISIEIDTDETEYSSIIKALKELKRGEKPLPEPPEPQREGATSQVEVAYSHPAPRVAQPIGFVPWDPEDDEA